MTPKEHESIRKLYPSGGVNAVLRAHPNLSEAAIRGWAYRNDIWRAGAPRTHAKPPPHSSSPTRDFTNRKRSIHLRRWRYPVRPRQVWAMVGGVFA